MVINSFRFQATSQLSSAVLTTFPNDDLQVSYTNMAGLRLLSADARGRQSFDPSLPALGESMRPLGIDSAKDIDEVMLGWRDETMDPAKTRDWSPAGSSLTNFASTLSGLVWRSFHTRAPTYIRLAPQARWDPSTLRCSVTP